MEIAIGIDDLVVVRGKRPVLHGLSCTVPRGSVTGLLGPSGSGKTTLMRCIVGVQKIQSGSVTVLGQPAGTAPLRHKVGYLTQAPSVYADLTVRENTRYFASLHGVSTRQSDQSIIDVGLRKAADQLVCAAVQARTARPRRTDRRPGPRAAKRPVAAVPRPRRGGHHAAGVQPRHGRGPPV
jgi:ABC-2 type transport system ATP-binding protein